MGFACSTLAILLFGVLVFLRNTRSLAEVQLRLDHCISKTALELRSKLNSIESSNGRIRIIRLALIADPEPSTRTLLETTLFKEVLEQELHLTQWKGRQLSWIALSGCDQKGDRIYPLPKIPWIRDPPDAVGLQPLRWSANSAKNFHIELEHSPRQSAARVFQGRTAEGVEDVASKWSAQWAPPHLQFWTSGY